MLQNDSHEKLYILTYRTLPIGYQAIQCSHTLREFVNQFPEHDKKWYKTNNSIILVTCSNYKDFLKLLNKADKLNIQYINFIEPDIGYHITATAFVPGEQTAYLLRHCQLLGGPTELSLEPKSLLDYKLLMKRTPQGESNVWQHGKDCCNMLERILKGEKLPRIEKVTWLESAIKEFPYELEKDIYTYLQFHDIGKTITYDGEGHYPNHAQESARLWRLLDNRERIATWIENDMVMHSGTVEEANKLVDKNILRLTALVECYSNAEMFGGFESDSFKIKLKKIIRNGK